MAEAKTAMGVVRDAWDTAAQLGTLKGLLFVLSLVAFIDVAAVHLSLGNLMALDWKTPLPGPGPLLLALAAFISGPLLVAPFIQGTLGFFFGARIEAFFSRRAEPVQRNDDCMLPSRLRQVALFEKDAQLGAYVQTREERWEKGRR